MTEELHSCPGCREESNIEITFTVYGHDYYVRCGNCGASGPHAGTEEQAAHRWNQMCRDIREVKVPQKFPRTNE